MGRRAPVVAWLCCVVAAALAGCSRKQPSAPAAPRPAQRIVSCSPSTTEILFALGAGDKLIAVSTADDYPPEAKTISPVGDFAMPNLELLLQLKPDLVVSTYLVKPALAQELEKRGIRVYLAPQSSFADLFAAIRELGELAGAEQRAAELVADMRRRIAEVERQAEKVAPADRPRVFIEISADPLYTAGGGSFLDELVTRAGGANIAATLKQPFAQINSEFVIRQDPDAILVCYMTSRPDAAEQIGKRIGWSQMKAVKHSRIIADIHSDLLCRPGPRLVAGLEQLHRRLYPAPTPPAGGEAK